ncbi:MAG TPA: TPM domain-containing protein [Methylomirabilota bacterium]|nr:TPM domain-containing protein [Methylomirabilota bacterium]
MASPPRWIKRVLADEDLAAVSRAIALAEAETSGEIRLHLERRLPAGDPLTRARQVFTELGMPRTRERNGVLIYLAFADRRLAIVGDEGIHASVGADYWDRVRDLLVERLREGRVREALVEAVTEVGRTLRAYFPRRPDDTNELSDRVSTR